MRVALVTGASRGVGRGIAASLHEADFKVFATGRNIHTANLLRNVVRVRCDHLHDDETAEIFAQIASETNHLDVRAYCDGLRIAGVPDERLRHIENLFRTEGLPGYCRNWLDVPRRGGKMPMSSTFRAQLYVRAGEPVHALESLAGCGKIDGQRVFFLLAHC